MVEQVLQTPKLRFQQMIFIFIGEQIPLIMIIMAFQ